MREDPGTLLEAGASGRAPGRDRDRAFSCRKANQGLNVNTCRLCSARLPCWGQQDIHGWG